MRLPFISSFFPLFTASLVSPFSSPAVPTSPSRAFGTRLHSTSPSSPGGAIASTVDVARAMEAPDLPAVPPMSKRLFLVRHGEVINPGVDRPVYYGAMDVPLSPLGELEAKVAAAYLERFDLQRVAASPLSRALFGANEVLSLQKAGESGGGGGGGGDGGGGEVILYEGFTELDRGEWCGRTKDEIGPEMLVRFDACDLTVTPEGGESYPALKQRVLRARDELLEITDCGRASALVSHLQVTRSMLSDALETPTDKMAGLKIATASVTCIDFCSVTGEQTVHFQSFKPDFGLEKSKDMAN